jgi:FkbM family methyltransferase
MRKMHRIKKIGSRLLNLRIRSWIAALQGKFPPTKLAGFQESEYLRYFAPDEKSIVFDVGGEFGSEAIQFSRMVGTGGRVYVFECFPSHIEKLKRTADQTKNIVIVEKACWNSTADIVFYPGHTPGSNTAIPDCTGQRGQSLADMSADKLCVAADTLDNLWTELTDRKIVDFLKMDIEGAELEALEGAEELLKNTTKVVIAA